jgi:hypothetical protein
MQESELDCNIFGKHAITRASTTYNAYPNLHPQTLDATLLVAWVKEKMLTAYAFGDGVLVHRKKDSVKTVHIQITSGAPDYLSYSLDQFRRNAYDDLKDNKKEIWTSYNGIWTQKPFDPFVYEYPVEDGDVVSIISDGINSFRKANNDSIPWTELIEEFTGFKNFEGQFVTRRISAFKRQCLKDGTVHTDDISIASILV